MDDTQQSRVSDAAAAATRKRRSSILKSQRPARTPFSELEFNVATPTDTSKSRRVSFSRRTGVAEFVTNEATTTWKNFYEEHNKSLESSNNDSEANASRQPVGHLGKRMFDQQFEEVEAVDFISGLANGSLNNINFSHQIASLECTADGKLAAPQNKFELSAFTEQSKLFGNDFTAPSIGDNSGRIDIDFSAIQKVEKDDLDEIEKDLERGSSNIGCHGPFSNGQNMSEYIEVDLNMTHVDKNDEDMSITDTIHSPVQDVSTSASKDKKTSLNNDWVVDKENIAINPYAAPCETNFVVNEEPDQVLVFDGKRLTLQSDLPEKDKNYRQTLLPNSSAETPQRKTIVLNVNDDLPNFIEDNNMLNSKYETSGFSGLQEIKADEDEISETVPLYRHDIKSKRNTIHDRSGNISMTQALPTNIICQSAVIRKDVNATKRRTIVFNESTNNISMTESVPVKLFSSGTILPERRRTIVYEDDTGNISITQAVPSNVFVNENSITTNNQKTIVFERDEDNISMTQALPSKILGEKATDRKTTVFDDSSCNVSYTQALPTNIMLADKQTKEKRQTIIYENDTGNISVTQALPANVILSEIEKNLERRRTVLYEDDTNNISVTQALPSNIIQEKAQLDENKENNDAEDILTTNIISKDNENPRRKTIVFSNDAGNISITQAIPTQLIPGYSEEKTINELNTSKKPEQAENQNKNITTTVHDNDEFDISMTQAISGNIIEQATNKIKTFLYDNDELDVSMTDVISANIIQQTNDRKTIVYDDEANISMTLAISANDYLLDKLNSAADINKPEEIEDVKIKVIDYDVYEQDNLKPNEDDLQDKRKSTVYANNMVSEMSMTTAIPTVETENRGTVIFDNHNCDISMTKQIPAEFVSIDNQVLNKTEIKLDVSAQNQAACRQSDVIVMQASTINNKQTLNVNAETAYDSRDELPTKENSSASSPVTSVSPMFTYALPIDAEEVQDKLIASTIDQNIDKATAVNYDANPADEENKQSLITSVPSIDHETDNKSLMAVLESNSSSGDKLMDTADETSSGSMFYITKDCEAVIQTDNNELKDKKDKLEQNDHFQSRRTELQTDGSQNSDLSNRSSNDFDGDEYCRQQGHNYNKANDTQQLLDLISDFTDNDEAVRLVDVKVNDHCKSIEHRRLSVAPNRQSIALNRDDLMTNISMAQAALQKSRLALDDSDCADEDTRDDSVDMSKNSRRSSYEVVKTLNFDDESIGETSLKVEEKYSLLKKTVFSETAYIKEAKGKVIPTYLKDVSDGIKELMLDLVKPISDNMPFQSGPLDKGVLENMSTHSTQVQANLTASSQIDFDDDTASDDFDRLSSTASVALDQPERPKSRAVKFSFSDGREMPEEHNFHSSSIHNFHSAPNDDQIYQLPSSEVLVFDHLNPLNNVLLAPTNVSYVHKYNPRQSEEMMCSIKSRSNDISNYHNNGVETVATTQCLVPGTNPKQEKIYVYQNSDQFNQKDEQIGQKDEQLGQKDENLSQKDEQFVQKDEKLSQKDEQFSQKDDQISQKSDQSTLQVTCTSSGRTSVDQSVDAITKHLKDDEVNTLIAMRGNKELLQASSSLTLVDDQSGSEKSNSPSHTKEQTNFKVKDSRLASVTKQAQAHSKEIDELSEISLRDRNDYSYLNAKGKKRNYSPAMKQKQDLPSKDVTPKPLTKMQKTSKSPKPHKEPTKTSPRNDATPITQSNSQNAHKPKTRLKKSPKTKDTKDTKSGHTITVQQVLTDHNKFEAPFKHKNYSENKMDELNLHKKSEPATYIASQSDASFTSSKNLNLKNGRNSTGPASGFQSPHETPVQDPPAQMDWHSEVKGTTNTNQIDSDSGVNIVAKIDMLPFMGSHECEWESKSSPDTWAFRLQHGRLRLTTRLAHRQDNASRTRVRGDTPVLDIAVETVQLDPKNPVATLCVRFACETMRYIVSHALRTPCYARDIPPLLRRCAAVARVALRWGRAMHDAKLQLAYTLDNDGNLSLKVANVRLRSVWEVTMHIELVVDDNRSVPWPKADSVRVTRVVSELLVPDEDVRRVLSNMPRDWGHAPRAIWRMFKYLKHKTRDDDLILA